MRPVQMLDIYFTVYFLLCAVKLAVKPYFNVFSVVCVPIFN